MKFSLFAQLNLYQIVLNFQTEKTEPSQEETNRNENLLKIN